MFDDWEGHVLLCSELHCLVRKTLLLKSTMASTLPVYLCVYLADPCIVFSTAYVAALINLQCRPTSDRPLLVQDEPSIIQEVGAEPMC